MASLKKENIRIDRNDHDSDKSFYWDVTTGEVVSESVVDKIIMDEGFFFMPEQKMEKKKN